MRVVHTRIGAQPAAHFEPRHIGHHPVDEGTDRPLDKPPRAIGIKPREGIANVPILEIGKVTCHRVCQEDIDRSHAAVSHPVKGSDAAVM